MRYALLAVTAALVSGAFNPRPAVAHAILMTSEPAAGATVPEGQTHIVLHYNSRIDQRRGRGWNCGDRGLRLSS